MASDRTGSNPPIDSSEVALGAVSGPVATYVDPDGVVALAAAVNDGNPAYRDGGAVPPTYPVAPALAVVHGLPAYPAAVLGRTRAIVHAEHDLVVHRPPAPGTWLHTTAERVGALPTRAGMIVAQVVRATDDDGNLLVEQHWVVMLIGPATGSPRGQLPPGHAFPDEARRRPAETVTLATTRDQTFRYAGASGDRNPMHVDDEVARERGFPRKFNQGLCTVGLVTGGLIEMVAGGDPARVARVAVRFSAPAFPGDPVEVDLYDLGATEAGNASFAFEARSGGATVLAHGRFEARP